MLYLHIIYGYREKTSFMRKVSILFFFCFTVVRAQYFPVGMTWEEIIVNPEMDTESSSVIYGTHLFEISSDTLIDGATYRNVMVDGNSCDLYIRENGEKVWLLSNDYPSEILLYDFAWDNGQYIVTEHLKEQDNGELKLIRDTMMVGDYQTTTFDSQTYQYHRDSFHRSTIRGIGNVAELNRNFCLLGYKEKRTPLPGLDYFKVHWIMKDGRVIFQSENVADWTIAVPSYETIDTDYHPMLKDGRMWNCIKVFYNDGLRNDTTEFHFWIDGTDEVDGRLCYKLYSGHDTFKYYYEGGPKVYQYSSNGWQQVFDFSLKEGDVCDAMGSLPVSATDVIETAGGPRRRLTFGIRDYDNNDVSLIEGIGCSLSGPVITFNEIVSGNFLLEKLQSVYDGDVCIYDSSDLNHGMTDAVHTITHDDSQSIVFFDLQGRRMQGKPAKGVYIRNGRKVVVK